MIIYVLLNIAVVLAIVGFDLYRHQYKQLKFSSLLLAIVINTTINMFIIQKYNFISTYTTALLIIWLLLQLYVNYKVHPFVINNQKFLASIFAIILSLSAFIMDISSDQSVYMSIPYLSPAIFLIGAIILFTGTFKSTERNRLPLFKRIQAPIMIGTIIIALSFVVMMMLTPFWYIFLGIYVLFIAFIIWQKVFQHY